MPAARVAWQGYELTVPVTPGVFDAAALARVRTFDEVYAARYGYSSPSEPVEVVTWKLPASAGARLAGPAIVEERESTSVLPPGTSASVDEYANLTVDVRSAR